MSTTLENPSHKNSYLDICLQLHRREAATVDHVQLQLLKDHPLYISSLELSFTRIPSVQLTGLYPQVVPVRPPARPRRCTMLDCNW